MLRGSGAAAPAPLPGQQPTAQPTAPQRTAQPTQQAVPQASGGGSPPPYAPNTVDQTVDYGGTTWKGQPGGGWVAQSRTGGASLTGLETSFNQPSINLPELYKNLYASSGIKDVETDLSAKSKAFTEQVAKIKNNPYLSEATMTGRLSKLQDKFNADTANIRDDIAMRKADVETQLNLEMKQFDINSQQAQQAFQQFNSLLNSGALDNASGEDIASITRATGISSAMIQSAIGVSRAKNAPKLNTQIIQVDDGENLSAVVINQDTGEIINKQVLGASTPTAAESKAALGGGGGGSDLTSTQQRKVAASATKALTEVDTNEDNLVSLEEYKKAIQIIIAATGVSSDIADNLLTNQMNDLGYHKWRW